MTDLFSDDKPHDECGVFGIYAPGRDVARITYFGLFALQHRGQESAGIATSDGRQAHIHKDMGLVSQVFNEHNLKPLVGSHAIGHNRYSTTGSSNVRNAGPYLFETVYGPLGVAHNGNLTNALQLRQRLLQRGVGMMSSSDSEVLTQVLSAPPEIWSEGASGNNLKQVDVAHEDWWVARLQAMMNVVEGAYSLAVLTRSAIYAVRDPLGLRPLCLGELDGGYVVASESCALQTIGARFVREVEPGEILRLDQHGVTSILNKTSPKRALCVFEHVYFARPDTQLEGQVIHDVRQRCGRQLAREAPADADIVVGVPDSAVPAAIGYSLESGIPYSEGLIKNRYIARTFIQPDAQLRKVGVRLKYNPLTANLRGKRVVMVDDSIVRGSTVGPLIRLLRDGGASEVHVRVSSPPVRHPCFMGVDMATYRELIAHNMEIEQIRAHVGADSLAYLSIEGLMKATHGIEGATLNGNTATTLSNGQSGFCAACFSGNYPIPIPKWLFEDDRDKKVFETP